MVDFILPIFFLNFFTYTLYLSYMYGKKNLDAFSHAVSIFYISVTNIYITTIITYLIDYFLSTTLCFNHI